MANCRGVPPGGVERKAAYSRTEESLILENPLAVKLLLEKLLGVKVSLNHNNLDLPKINAARWEIDRLVKLLQEGN